MATASFSSASGRARALTPPPEAWENGPFDCPYAQVRPGMRLLFDGWSADVVSVAELAGWIYLEVCAESVGQVVTVRRRPEVVVRAEWKPPEPDVVEDDIFTL
jgi:hypothetical protein